MVGSVVPGAAAMTGGTPQNPEPGWAARIIFNGSSYCTGSLIAPQWILTAGHCVLGASAATTMISMHGLSFQAAAVYEEPQYTREAVQYPDVGLVKLPFDATSVLGASILPLGTTDDLSYFSGRTVTLFGYGHDNNGHIPTYILKSPDGAWAMATSCGIVPSDQCFTRLNSRTAVTGGDSGGPWVGWRHGGWRILAVVSGYPDTRITSLQAATSPASPAVAAWIQSVISPASTPQPTPTPTPPPVPTPPPPGTVTASVGGPVNNSNCSAAACAYLAVTYSGFSGGTHTVTCSSSRSGDYYSYTTSSTTSSTCYYGFSGDSVWASVDGVKSNTITWPAGAAPPTPTPPPITTPPPPITPPPPPPPVGTVTASAGASVSNSSCTAAACAYLTITFSGFADGAHTITCNSSRFGTYFSYTTSNPTTSTCFYGYTGDSVWATVDGVKSNVVSWPVGAAPPTPTPPPITTPPPPPPPSVGLAQGPSARYGFWYAISLSNFAPSSRVSVTCFENADPGGFYTFTLTTDGAGNAYTQSWCYAGYRDHWVVANGVASNHVGW